MSEKIDDGGRDLASVFYDLVAWGSTTAMKAFEELQSAFENKQQDVKRKDVKLRRDVPIFSPIFLCYFSSYPKNTPLFCQITIDLLKFHGYNFASFDNFESQGVQIASAIDHFRKYRNIKGK